MGKQNRKLLENLRKYEEKEVKQQESKILEQRATKETKGKRKRPLGTTGKVFAVFLENDKL